MPQPGVTSSLEPKPGGIVKSVCHPSADYMWFCLSLQIPCASKTSGIAPASIRKKKTFINVGGLCSPTRLRRPGAHSCGDKHWQRATWRGRCGNLSCVQPQWYIDVIEMLADRLDSGSRSPPVSHKVCEISSVFSSLRMRLLVPLFVGSCWTKVENALRVWSFWKMLVLVAKHAGRPLDFSQLLASQWSFHLHHFPSPRDETSLCT